MRRTGPWLIVLSIGLSLAVPLAYGGLDGLNALRALSATALALLLIMAMLGWLCGAARLRLLAGGLGVRLTAKSSVATTIACEFAAATTPFGSGSLPTHVFLLSRQGLGSARTLAILAMDSAVDLVFFATALPLAFLAYNLNSDHNDLLGWVWAAGVLLIFVLCLAYALVYHHRRLMLQLGRAIRSLPWLKTKQRRLARIAIQFRNGLCLLLKLGAGPLVILYLLCMTHWLIRYSILPTLLWATGHSAPWSFLFLAQSLALFVGQMSALPGGGGGVEIALSMLLHPYLTAPIIAATLLGWRFITLYWSMLVGAPVFIWLVRQRSTHPEGVIGTLQPPLT